MSDMKKKCSSGGPEQRAYFVYVDEKVLSGQRRATELLIEQLTARGWVCQRLSMPGFDRQSNAPLALLVFLVKLVVAWWGAFKDFIKAPGLMHVNLGQTLPAMLREGTPLLICALFYERHFAVISLHGSWFMQWRRQSLKARWLVFLANRAAFVTVLGEDQRNSLIRLGVAAQMILIVDNTCELEPVDEQFVIRKQQGEPVRVLFLSNLVDTKGYPEFLDGLEAYSRLPGAPHIEAVLCGQVIGASHAIRLRDASQAHLYISEKLAAINQIGVVSISWLPDSEGQIKAELFARTTIFIFPSKLEAQPLVVLEAMASGCAIISSHVGQIARMLAGTSNLVIENPNGSAIAGALRELVDNPDRRTQMGLLGLRRFCGHFTRKRYGDLWQEIAGRVVSGLKLPRSPIWFAFADTAGFSGQKEAMRIVYDNVSRERWHIRLMRMPAFERTLHVPSALLRYTIQSIVAMREIVRAMLTHNIVFHIALGQTRISLLRDAMPLLFITAVHDSSAAIVSLNGSNFMAWSHESREARLFRFIMRRAACLTVLGQTQRRQAIALGIPEQKVLIVTNTCDAPETSRELVLRKHKGTSPIRILHLSSLIDTKGYPAFLEALLVLGQEPGPLIEAVLCGRIALNAFSTRFKSQDEAQAWIEQMLVKINATQRVQVRWVPGAEGDAKWALYREAQLFVFPSTYLVEAQPLVLLEAMAYGCAIISSNVGEIPTILTESAAVLLEQPDVDQIVAALRQLIAQPERRTRLGLLGWERYQASYTKAAHILIWEALFNRLSRDKLQ